MSLLEYISVLEISFLLGEKLNLVFNICSKFLGAGSGNIRKINTLKLCFGVSKTEIEIILKSVILIIDRPDAK